eukprot:4118873-Pleurochrysis_carterae.AAC.1
MHRLSEEQLEHLLRRVLVEAVRIVDAHRTGPRLVVYEKSLGCVVRDRVLVAGARGLPLLVGGVGELYVKGDHVNTFSALQQQQHGRAALKSVHDRYRLGGVLQCPYSFENRKPRRVDVIALNSESTQ